jgi:two-component system LytT family response regulator
LKIRKLSQKIIDFQLILSQMSLRMSFLFNKTIKDTVNCGHKPNFLAMKTLYLTRHQQIEVNDIMYLQSESNYTLIHTINKHKTISSQTLHLVHSSIEYDTFIRINRSYILNIEHISTYSLENNKLILKLSNGEKFTASRRRVKNCLDKIEIIQKRTH